MNTCVDRELDNSRELSKDGLKELVNLINKNKLKYVDNFNIIKEFKDMYFRNITISIFIKNKIK